jgi:hypothetical protein
MSVLDLSSLLTLSAPEMLAPPDPPATPAIDASTTSTSDSSSSGSSNGLSLGTGLSGQQQVEVGLLGGRLPVTDPYGSAAEEAAAALIDLSGGSNVTIDEFEASVPPNLAAASALLDELTTNGSVSEAAMGSLYTLLDSSAALSLTTG